MSTTPLNADATKGSIWTNWPIWLNEVRMVFNRAARRPET